MNEHTKKILGLFGAIALVAVSVYLLTATYDKLQEISRGTDVLPAKTVTVNGEGKVTVIPNIAEVRFSVVSQGLTPKQAQDSNTLKINSVVGYLKGAGIEDKDIKTTGYSLYPQYRYLEGVAPLIVGYELNQSLTVKIRDLNKVGQIISNVVERGVNQTSGIVFTVDDQDLERFRNEARGKAFQAAKEKAMNMAGAAGVELGEIISFSENVGGIYPPPIYEAGFGRGGGAAVFEPSIEPGSTEIVVNANITYALR